MMRFKSIAVALALAANAGFGSPVESLRLEGEP